MAYLRSASLTVGNIFTLYDEPAKHWLRWLRLVNHHDQSHCAIIGEIMGIIEGELGAIAKAIAPTLRSRSLSHLGYSLVNGNSAER